MSTGDQANSAYSVQRLQCGDERRWDRFVEECPNATFYHLSGWRTIMEEQLRHRAIYLYCERDGELVGVLPLVHLKTLLFGNALISLPFLVYGGPASVDPRAEDELVNAACELADDLDVDHLELRNQNQSSRDWPCKHCYVTFRKQLDPDPDKNFLNIPRKQRAMIRKGIKAGLKAEQDDDVRRLYGALLPCKRNLGTPFFSERYLQAIKDTFADSVEILTVTRDDATICSVMSFRFRNEILPYYGGGHTSARDLKGNDFMYWAVMKKACHDGVEVFDYGRSMVDTGSYRFKKHWGFESSPLAYEFFMVREGTMPNMSPSNPRFRFAIDAWKKLPLAVAGVVGPRVARFLG